MLEVETCSCTPLYVCLVYAGYFPCAPHRPSIVFSMDVLEKMKNVWAEIAPNVTGWAEGMERSLRDRGYHFGQPVSPKFKLL